MTAANNARARERARRSGDSARVAAARMVEQLTRKLPDGPDSAAVRALGTVLYQCVAFLAHALDELADVSEDQDQRIEELERKAGAP